MLRVLVMSRKSTKVYPNVWKSEKMREVSASAKLLGIYFLTSPFYCMVGIYEQPKERIRKHTGLSHKELDQTFAKLIGVGFVRYDDATEVVWVVDMAVSQVSDGRLSESQEKEVLNELARLSIECQFPFVDEFIQLYIERYPFLPRDAEELCFV
tara:strand:- start:531 stop:992 length:462 start_codon:yes stop_codon:yes gene_type:complete